MDNKDVRMRLFDIRNRLGAAITKARKLDHGLSVDLGIVDDQIEALIEALRESARR